MCPSKIRSDRVGDANRPKLGRHRMRSCLDSAPYRRILHEAPLLRERSQPKIVTGGGARMRQSQL
jgi:hypothetical protein